MCSLELEVCPVWNETRRVARKQHTCATCSTLIQPKTSYVEYRYVFDGSAGTEHACEACNAALDEFGQAHGQKPMPQNFWQELQDCIDRRTPANRIGPDEWASELAGIKRRWRVSPAGRHALQMKWARRAERH